MESETPYPQWMGSNKEVKTEAIQGGGKKLKQKQGSSEKEK